MEIVDRRVQWFLAALLASAGLVERFNRPVGVVDMVVTVGIGFILGGLAATIVLAFGGEAFQDVEIQRFGVSITAFSVVVFVVRHAVF